MSALYPLENPLTRQEFLSTAQNWRGNWNATTQYFSNDLVRSQASGNVLRATSNVLGGTDGGVSWVGQPFPWIWTSNVPPTTSPLTMTATASPSPAYTFLQARRTIPGPNPTQTFYARFDAGGNAILEYAWDGFVILPWTLNGRPVQIVGDNTSVLRLTNEQTGATGVLTVDPANDLYWNGVKLN